MARLEDLTRGATVKGVLPDRVVTVVDVRWFGSDVIELTSKETSGRLGNELVYHDREPTLEIVQNGRPWSFDTDGSLFRLVSEAHRIRLAHLFDPRLAVHTSLIDPLPHQITAVYGEMLPRQPLRFLLADDPGAGKTIMAGLLLNELLVRGDVHRCLICCPGSLVDQWQDELWRRFQLPFGIITAEIIEELEEDAPSAEIEAIEEQVVDQATAARTIGELQAEIAALRRLEALAFRVRQSGTDRKWEELSALLQGNAAMFDVQGSRRKLIIFTEHRDTLNYLRERITTLLGRAEAVTVTKHEILTALNKPDDFLLAIVLVDGEQVLAPRYVRRPFQREPGFGVTGVNYDLRERLARTEEPR